MGIIIKNTLYNSIVTYLGFAIGALNTLFLYTYILSAEDYGLATFLIGTGSILMPLFSFGVHNTVVKFYLPKNSDKQEEVLSFLLWLPFLTMIIFLTVFYFFKPQLISVLTTQNERVGFYYWHLLLTGVAMAYFEIFFGIAKVYLKTVFGNFLKEVFSRIGVSILLILVFTKFITVALFFDLIVVLFLLRFIVMMLYTFRLCRPKIIFKVPHNFKEMFTYSALIIVGGSAALVLTEIDKFMINQFQSLDKIAFYSVGVFIATVIIVPARAMHQITYPLTARLLLENQKTELQNLYYKSAISLFTISGFLLALIMANLNDLYFYLPAVYRQGFWIVFWIGLAKLAEAAMGNANSILFNSKFYRFTLLLGALLALMTIVLNILLIPLFGILGAAYATLISLLVFNSIKVVFIYKKLNIHPFSKHTASVLILIILFCLFGFWDFRFIPFWEIICKSILMTILFWSVVWFLGIIPEFNQILKNVWFNRKTR